MTCSLSTVMLYMPSFPFFRMSGTIRVLRGDTVESYNEEKILRYYERNGFVPLYKTDVIEKQYYDIPQDEPLKTRLLYFDLKKD